MSSGRTPVLVTILIIVMALPAFSAPWLLAAVPHTGTASAMRAIMGIYPFYLLLSAWLAYKAWATRPEVTWILLAVMLLSTASVFYLALNPQLL